MSINKGRHAYPGSALFYNLREGRTEERESARGRVRLGGSAMVDKQMRAAFGFVRERAQRSAYGCPVITIHTSTSPGARCCCFSI